MGNSREELYQAFSEIFDCQPEAAFFSPGRINLIGEHTDYNGGHVFPAAISLGTYGVVAKRKDKRLRFYSANFSEQGIIDVDLDNLAYDTSDHWANYAKGVIHFLKEAGHMIETGLDVYVSGNIPNGSGLSSSASLELLIGVMVAHVYQLDVSRLDLVKIGQKTENEFIGVNSGIMDQFAVGMGQEKQAIYLDTNRLTHELLPLDLGDSLIVIMNTNKRRELADSKYNQRRSECDHALSDLQTKLAISSLGDLDNATFDEYSYLITDATCLKRARHAVSENQRTLSAKETLKAGDLAKFGRLMNASHVSLEHDYDVTGLELDTLVHTAWKQEGVWGARMTGAGFGGCAIALVRKDQVERFQNQVEKRYQEVVGYAPSFYVAEIVGGTSIL